MNSRSANFTSGLHRGGVGFFALLLLATMLTLSTPLRARGEVFIYKVNYSGLLPLATMWYEPNLPVDGTDSLLVDKVTIRSNPFLPFFHHDSVNYLVHTPDGTPVRFHSTEVLKGGDTLYSEYVYDHVNSLITVNLFYEGEREDSTRDTLRMLGPSFDGLAFIASLVRGKFSAGSQTIFTFYTTRYGPVDLELNGETRRFNLKQFPERKIGVHARGDIHFVAIAGLTGAYDLWYNAAVDPGLILSARLKVIVGSVRVRLVRRQVGGLA